MIDPISIANQNSAPVPEANPRVPVKMLGQDEFLKLLVTQMQNQDPLAPMQDTEFIAQMAQFTSLEQSRQMSDDMSVMRKEQGMQHAVGLLGQHVTVAFGEGERMSGTVREVQKENGEPKIVINGRRFDLQDVIHVSATDGDKKTETQ